MNLITKIVIHFYNQPQHNNEYEKYGSVFDMNKNHSLNESLFFYLSASHFNSVSMIHSCDCITICECREKRMALWYGN